MILEKYKLIFKHNGNVRFSVSNPNISAEEARLKGEYGHINSITAIGFSTKNKYTGEGNKIDKFGVGFMAIFQYFIFLRLKNVVDSVNKFNFQ